jgi:hypothetical protein
MDMKVKPRVLVYRWPTAIMGPLPPTNDGRGSKPSLPVEFSDLAPATARFR